jgi:peptidyl-prolyl cis-trans isomerase C
MTGRRAMIAAVLAMAASVSAYGDASVIAEVGGRRLTKDDVITELLRIRRAGDVGQALKTMTPVGRKQVLDDLIAERLYALEAKASGLDRDPKVAQAILRATDAILSDAYVERALNEPPISDAGLRSYFDAHKSGFTAAARVKARHIVVKTRAEADDVLGTLQHGGDFAAVAASRSIDATTKTQGGDLGWIPRGVMTPAFENVVFTLKPGALSGVIETSYGFHVVRVDDAQEPAIPAFDAVKDQVRQHLIAERRRALVDQLQRTYPVTIHQDVLESLGK